MKAVLSFALGAIALGFLLGTARWASQFIPGSVAAVVILIFVAWVIWVVWDRARNKTGGGS
jgi:MFS superfamily sulfate permease-like transporter